MNKTKLTALIDDVGDLEFYTNSGGAPSQRMRIRSGGGIINNYRAAVNVGQSATAIMILDSNSRISLSNNDDANNNTLFGKSAGLSLDSNSVQNTFIGENVSNASNGCITDNE